MIHPQDLKYFIEISKTLHLSRAAERLGLTQPSLSHCLKRMEDSVGHALFLRSKKGLTLTPAGQKLLQSAVTLLQHWEDVVHAAQAEATQVTGTIRIGCHSAVANYMLPRFLPQFLKQNSQVNFQLRHGLSRHMTEQVISGQLDVAIVVNPVKHPDLILKEVETDRVTLWKTKTCTNPDVLIVEPDLLQTQKLLNHFSSRGFRFSRIIESSSLEVISQLVNSGAGYGILPERVIRAIAAEGLISVKDAPEVKDRICLIFKSEFRKSKRGQELIRSVSAQATALT